MHELPRWVIFSETKHYEERPLPRKLPVGAIDELQKMLLSLFVIFSETPGFRQILFSETQRCQGVAKGRGALASLGLWPYMFVLPSLG